MIRHPLHLLPPLIVLGVAATLTGCAPPPAPEPTPLFASEEEAFAAAEETYRAYTDASNLERSDPNSAHAVDYLVGLAAQDHLDNQRHLDAEGLVAEGEIVVVDFLPVSASIGPTSVRINADVCLDVSSTRVLNADEVDVTPHDRSATASLRVEFVSSAGSIRISNSAVGSSSC
ncbi:MAG: hypothetical protein ACQEW8_03455 [Actinomycetota bacterium]